MNEYRGLINTIVLKTIEYNPLSFFGAYKSCRMRIQSLFQLFLHLIETFKGYFLYQITLANNKSVDLIQGLEDPTY